MHLKTILYQQCLIWFANYHVGIQFLIKNYCFANTNKVTKEPMKITDFLVFDYSLTCMRLIFQLFILEKLDTAKQEYRVIADQIGQSYDLAAY